MNDLGRLVLSSAIASLVTFLSPLGVSTSALAQSDCACIISAPASGPMGSISTANGDVFKTGASGLENAGAGTAVNVGDVISTGALSSASVSLGGGCDLALGASTQVVITPVGGNICVRVVEEPVGGLGGETAGLAVAGGLAAGALLYVGLGQGDPASN